MIVMRMVVVMRTTVLVLPKCHVRYCILNDTRGTYTVMFGSVAMSVTMTVMIIWVIALMFVAVVMFVVILARFTLQTGVIPQRQRRVTVMILVA